MLRMTGGLEIDVSSHVVARIVVDCREENTTTVYCSKSTGVGYFIDSVWHAVQSTPHPYLPPLPLPLLHAPPWPRCRVMQFSPPAKHTLYTLRSLREGKPPPALPACFP